MSEDRYGSGNWTLAEIQQRFTPPVIAQDATAPQLREVNAKCAELFHRAIWERRQSSKKHKDAERKYQRTYKEIHLGLCRQNRSNPSQKAWQRQEITELKEAADTYIGDYTDRRGIVYDINVPELKDIADNAKYEVDLWDDVMKDIVTTAKSSETNGFNLSVEGKYGGVDPTRNQGAKDIEGAESWNAQR